MVPYCQMQVSLNFITKPVIMKIKPVFQLLLAAISLITMENTVSAQQKNEVITAQKWLKSKEWNSQIKLDVHSSVNPVEFYKQYHANPALWDKVFQFLKNQNLDTLAAGKYPIDGDNAYASITEAPSKELDKAGWESHRKYIDLQYVIKGKEQIGVVPLSKATVTKPYDETKDGANYTAEGTYYTAQPGTFFLFFPEDVHRPNIKVAGYDTVKKLVIKVRVAN